MPSKILIIDDSLTIRKLVEIAFRSSGVVVEVATSGQEGLVKARMSKPDAILLDFVLPDIRGIDVCDGLSKDPTTASIPIIVISAKDEKIRDLFRPYGSLFAFLTKPFKQQDLVERVNQALAKSRQPFQPAARAEVSTFKFEDKEAAALALYGHLSARLAQIPTWMSELGTNSPGKFFARRILTAEMMDGLLEALLPIFRKRLEAEMLKKQSGAAISPQTLLRGQLGVATVIDLLDVASRMNRPCEIIIEDGDFIGYVVRGKLMLVTSKDPEKYLTDRVVAPIDVPPDTARAANNEQVATGKPVYVTLAEAGYMPPCNLADVLLEQGTRLLVALLTAFRGLKFEIRINEAMPMYVEAYGIPVALEQLRLQQLREDPRRLAPLAKDDLLVERAPQFSRRVGHLTLTTEESLLLTCIDGRTPIADVIKKSGLAIEFGKTIVRRLLSIDLLQVLDPSTSVSGASLTPAPAEERQPTAVVVDNDQEGVVKPLEALLEARRRPIRVVQYKPDANFLKAVEGERPTIVILNASLPEIDAEQLMKGIRASPLLQGVPIVALLDTLGGPQPSSLSGCDAVLTKPVRYSDIERLLPG